jgi:hypothetical protein
MFNRNNLTVRVDFPALDNLLAFLRENRQTEIDALTTKLAGLASRLNAVKDGLIQAVKDETKKENHG